MKVKLLKSRCVFLTPNIKNTAKYYQNVLGLKAVKYLNSKNPHICLYRDKTGIILADSKDNAVVPN